MWNPIKSAPQDGTPVHLRTADGHTVVGHWGHDDEEEFWLTDVDDDPNWPHGCAHIVDAPLGWSPL